MLDRLPPAIRLLLILALWAAITLGFGAWQLIGSIGDVRQAGAARNYASAGLATVTLIERLQDERDIAAQVRATGSDNPRLQESHGATDRARADLESALRPFPAEAFGGQLTEVRSRLATLTVLRAEAFTEGRPTARSVTGYGELITPLIRLNERTAQRATALTGQGATLGPASGLSVLLLAAEALSQQRTTITTVLARDRSTTEERQALRTSAAVAQKTLAAFVADAAPSVLRVYQEAGDERRAGDADEFAARIIGDAGPYSTAGLLPADWADLSADRLNQIRLTAWTAATELIDRASDALNRHRMAAALGAVIGVGAVLVAGVAVVLSRRALLTRSGRIDPATPDGPATSATGWQDPLPCTLSHRTQELLDEQLTLISELESTETDPERLAALFQLDHLATRMRRHGENLITVTGQPALRHWPRPLSLLEILQAAVSESHRYDQVKLADLPTVAVDARAVIDTVHLLAELLDNATAANPQQAVTVFAGTWEDGRVTIEIHDFGPGMPFPRRALINARLTGALPDDPSGQETGLRIVALLARRHGMEVKLTHPEHAGLAATVTLPAALLVPVPVAVAPAGGVATDPVAATPAGMATEPYGA
ncbi:nitrate- and nitrite sensing domain-containing protein [Solwaraspora sp. WMMD1047]|uniref:sensor histidine kinase n=1 Tax=Solwaraspora sp. WMMD1047 TaxID=3016102 RepID=UPI0024178F63|nr:nitrate- and nitrite sensing domain-containing protein [Solwaraspora sp. WMMD1047]MDG4831384.1 nitrate- and nitrite sensing domain-containing protein [Solwaraspora sp. WMMD1047]